MSDIDTVVVDSLKALDPERPIREADIGGAADRHREAGARIRTARNSIGAGLSLRSVRGLRLSGCQPWQCPERSSPIAIPSCGAECIVERETARDMIARYSPGTKPSLWAPRRASIQPTSCPACGTST
jgi:hypothetical protein